VSDDGERFIEIPLSRAQMFGELISAARGWRGGLIPSTSTGLWGPTRNLLSAIAAFDRPPCDHPRSWRVYRVLASDADEVCGYCGSSVVTGLTERPEPSDATASAAPGPVSDDPATSSPPESSSPSP